MRALKLTQAVSVIAFGAILLGVLAWAVIAYPITTIAIAIGLLAWQFVWPNIAKNGPRYLVHMPDGSHPHYDRRGQAFALAAWGYARDPKRKDNGFPKVEAFWESHLPL